jgi:membrane-associated phospholipid phosphatase
LNSERSYLRPPDDAEPHWPERRAWPRLVVWGASQIVLFLALFQAYKMVRKTFITRAESVAFENALDILRWQGNLHLHFELSWQRWVLDQGDLIKVFNNIYAYYMYGFYACAIFLLVMSPPRYLYLRRVFIISMALALPWYVIYPLAPPRFMQPYGWDFVDTLAVYGPNYFSESGLVTANRFAAMPSMHCGWTMIAGIMVAAALPWKWVGRAIGLFLTLLLPVTVIVTGNHYWLDVVGGWIVIGLSLAINRWLPYPLPIRWPWQREARGSAVRASSSQA